MLYRSTDRLSRGGAPMKKLAHSASFHGGEKIAPLNTGIKHLERQAEAVDGGCYPSALSLAERRL